MPAVSGIGQKSHHGIRCAQLPWKGQTNLWLTPFPGLAVPSIRADKQSSRLLRRYDAVESLRGGWEDRVGDLDGSLGGLGGNIGPF